MKFPKTFTLIMILGANAWATPLYWDNNGATAGFGNATGTWAAPTTGNGTQGWSTDSAGTLLPGNLTTTTSDDLNFGTAANSLGSGTIAVSGNVTASTITFGSPTGNFTLSGGSITGASTSLTKNGTGILTLTGNNTFAGGLHLQGNGTLSLGAVGAGGTGTIYLESTQAGTGATLNITVPQTITNPIVMDSTTGREQITFSGNGSSTMTNFSIAGNGNKALVINNNMASSPGNNLTISNGVSGGSSTGGISFRGNNTVGGSFMNGAITLGGGTVNNNGVSNWTLNTAGSTWGATQFASSGNFILAADNALATGARLTWLANTTNGTLDLNGHAQSVAGLDANFAVNTNNKVNNSGASDAVLTLSGLTANYTFAGVIKDGGTNKVALVMNSAGMIQTLAGNNTYTGTTTVSAGTLVLSGTSASPTFSVATGATLTNNATSAITSALALTEGSNLAGTGNFTTSSVTVAADLGNGFTSINLGTMLTKNVVSSLDFSLTNVTDGTFTVFAGTSPAGLFSSVSVGGNTLTPIGGNIFSANVGGTTYTYDDSGFGSLIVAIPEPGTWILVGIGLTFLLYRKRRCFES